MAPTLQPMSLSQAQGHTQPLLASQPGAKKARTSAGFASTGMEAAFERFEREDATSGTIMKIELINFMNHAHLSVDLHPGVNFVFGKNGSGKSALLAGCMVGLGARALAAKQGTKLSSYIQSGKQMATVRVWLFNGGTDSYERATFGPQILIERTIDSKAGGKHVAKTADGAIVLTRGADLTKIFEHFNIQVSNPCVVLTQEKARRFLAATEDTVRYEFFMQATGLAAVKENLVDNLTELSRMEQNLEHFDRNMPVLRASVEAKKKAWDDANLLQTIDNEVAERKRKIAFVTAAEAEREAAAARAQVDTQSDAHEAAAAKVAKLKEALAEAARLEADAQARASSVGEQVGTYTNQIAAINASKQGSERSRAQLVAQKAELTRQRHEFSAAKGEHQRLISFGDAYPAIVEEVRRSAKLFSKPPIGPLGVYVTIDPAVEQQWATAIELAIGTGVLGSFVVNHNDDRLVLERLCAKVIGSQQWQRAPQRPQVTVSRFDDHPHTLPESKLPDSARFRRMIDVLHFSHPMAQQVVVDRSGCERLILCDSYESAKEVMWSGHDPPRNVSRACMRDGFSLSMNRGIQAQNRPSSELHRHVRRTTADMSGALSQIERELAELTAKLEAARRTAAQHVHAESTFKEREASMQKALRTTKKEVAGLAEQLTELNAEADFEEQHLQLQLETARDRDAEAERHLQQAEERGERRSGRHGASRLSEWVFARAVSVNSVNQRRG
jgi:chromosome segregation ATPase